MSIDKEKYKQLMKTVAGGENITPGIHNYCDRWCERCTHTSRCSVFKIEQEMISSKEELDIQNKQFWTSLSEVFNATVDLMHEKMQEFDINPDLEIPADDFITKSISNEMVVISRKYAMDIAKWLDLHREVLLNKFKILQNINSNDALLFAETIEVIQHYFMLIATKTYRASLVSDNDQDESEDARGSAKVTIIVIDRSIAAWTSLLKQFPALEDDILQYLKTLSQVKRLLLRTFPTAMQFVRPGFDE
jgi:hypothetical protein